MMHHPSCPARAELTSSPALSPTDARWTAERARCVCPPARRRRSTQLVELLSFAAMLGLVAGLPIYLLWRYTA